jgi:beta-glucosidase
VLAVDMDRPAVLAGLTSDAAALLAVFGASDDALIDVVTGRAAPAGSLPVELPRTMAAVEGQNPARPDDSARPLYRRGAGLRAGWRVSQ